MREIPEHWEVCFFKRVIRLIKDGTHGTYQRVSEGRVLLSAKNVHPDGIRISGEESLISEKDYLNITKNGFPKKGDLLVTCVGTIGRAFVYDLEESLAFQRSVAFLRLNKLKADSIFFKFYVESTIYQFALKQLTKTSAQGGVYMGDIMNSIIIFPPLSEQNEIANYIQTQSTKIATAISLKEQEIEKLREYKISLVNGVVTGKVKVL
jgi:type I restriction enzyme S subunit